jgi:SAM-dependent methyltransferase
LTDIWDGLVRAHGRQVVINPTISGAKLDAETARQIPVLREAIRPHLRGCEKTALDFGCGYGRFTHMLANLIDGRAVGFDPSPEMIRMAQWHTAVDYVCCPPDRFFDETRKAGTWFDLIFTLGVLGEPNIPLWGTVADLASILSDNGLVVVVDHVSARPDVTRWWRFREPGFYEDAFRTSGIDIDVIGTVAQLGDVMTIYGGRFTPQPA